jgi:hypothetical protein
MLYAEDVGGPGQAIKKGRKSVFRDKQILYYSNEYRHTAQGGNWTVYITPYTKKDLKRSDSKKNQFDSFTKAKIVFFFPVGRILHFET